MTVHPQLIERLLLELCNISVDGERPAGQRRDSKNPSIVNA